MKQKNQGLWTIKSFVIMLVVTFVGVPILIEGILQDALHSLFKNDLYAGTATGFVMAAVFLSALYGLMVQTGDRKIGFQSFSKRHWPHSFLAFCADLRKCGNCCANGMVWYDV